MMPTEIHAKATLPQRAAHEFREFAILTLYLYITLGAVIVMKTAVLHTEGIEFAPCGVAIVMALLLTKFMLVGRALKVGDHTSTRPLILSTRVQGDPALVLVFILTIT